MLPQTSLSYIPSEYSYPKDLTNSPLLASPARGLAMMSAKLFRSVQGPKLGDALPSYPEGTLGQGITPVPKLCLAAACQNQEQAQACCLSCANLAVVKSTCISDAAEACVECFMPSQHSVSLRRPYKTWGFMSNPDAWLSHNQSSWRDS